VAGPFAEALPGVRLRRSLCIREEAYMSTSTLVLALGLALPQLAAAQSQRAATRAPEDARWYPWIGCWQQSGTTDAAAQITCVRPGSGPSADILTVINGVVESREHLIVDGQPHPIDRDGCKGSQTATWSSSGNRIYIGGAYSCAGSLNGRSSRMLAILPSGVWLDVRNVRSGGGWVETVTRFHDAGLPATVPAAIRSEISHRGLAITTARASASAPVSASDIAEATQAVDTAVVQSWLAARGQGFVSGAAGEMSNPSGVPVFAGSSPAPAAQPAAAPQPEYSSSDARCDAFGCYERNGYSTYNGYVYSTHVRPYYGFAPSYYVPFAAPVVVIRGGGRTTPRGHSTGARPPVIHNPGGYRPGGQIPGVYGPSGHRPVTQTPSGQSPRGGVPSRIRP
jgi:hypothetical protein